MESNAQATAHWPGKLRELVRALSAPSPGVRRELWLLVHIAFAQYTRSHARRLSVLSREEVEDVASDKSLHLFHNLESGKWKPEERSDGEIMAYISKAARNGVLDALREAGKSVRDETAEYALPDPLIPTRPEETAELAHSRQFADAIRECSSKLQGRARAAWFMRVFLDMQSKKIGAHPRVDRSPGAVDILLKRTREAIGLCMRKRGFSTKEVPPGAFTMLWHTLHEELSELDR